MEEIDRQSTASQDVEHCALKKNQNYRYSEKTLKLQKISCNIVQLKSYSSLKNVNTGAKLRTKGLN